MTEFVQKNVTIKDIANEVGVSLGTVNKALTGKPGISERRRLEIQQAAQRMGYEVNSVAQIMSRKPITIGVVMPALTKGEYYGEDKYYESMKTGMEREFEYLKKYKINAVYYNAEKNGNSRDISDFKNWIKEYQPEAICFCPKNYIRNKEMMNYVVQKRIPLFLSGGGVEPPKECMTMVSVDAYLSGKMAADFFYCIHGREAHAAVLVESIETIIAAKKVSAFASQMEAYEAETPIIIETCYDIETMRKALVTLFEEHPEVNCIYVTNAKSIPVCEFIEEHNLKDTVTLVTTDYFDEIHNYMEKNIIKATLLQNQEKVGRLVVSQAYDYLVKKRTYGSENVEPTERIFVKPDFCLKSYFDV